MTNNVKVNAVNILNKSLEIDDYTVDSLVELIIAAKVVLIHDYDANMHDTNLNTDDVAIKLTSDVIDKEISDETN